jgi:hypothetical protein
MSDYVYGGKDNKQFYIEPGDSKFEVIDFDTKISGGSKTAGARITELKLRLDPSRAECYSGLIFHQSCSWKIDTFCKCTGIECSIGQMPEELKPGNEHLLVGLRGWGTFGIRETNGKKYNELRVWMTTKGKIPRAAPLTKKEVAQALPDNDDAPPF